MVRLTAPPVEGEANAALARVLGRALDVPPSAVRLLSGATGRHKRVLRGRGDRGRGRARAPRGGMLAPQGDREPDAPSPPTSSSATSAAWPPSRARRRARARPCASPGLVERRGPGRGRRPHRLASAPRPSLDAGGDPGAGSRGARRRRARRWCPASSTPTPTWPSRATATTRSARAWPAPPTRRSRPRAAASSGPSRPPARPRARTWPRLVAPALDEMLLCGTTTAEVKSGYGLETAAELRSLEAIRDAAARHPVTVVADLPGRPRGAGRAPRPTASATSTC